MTGDLKFFGFAGSLRAGSYNRALLRTTGELLPAGVQLEIFDLEGIPPFNQELEIPLPARVKTFKDGIRAADAIVFVTPEYNYSISGVMKNAIDWGTRPDGDNSFNGKPATILSASNGIFGGARAQYHLRQVLVSLNMRPLAKPEMFVTLAPQKFNDKLILTDEATRQKVKEQMAALAAWTLKLKAAP
jgi:chromate reductase